MSAELLEFYFCHQEQKSVTATAAMSSSVSLHHWNERNFMRLTYKNSHGLSYWIPKVCRIRMDAQHMDLVCATKLQQVECLLFDIIHFEHWSCFNKWLTTLSIFHTDAGVKIKYLPVILAPEIHIMMSYQCLQALPWIEIWDGKTMTHFFLFPSSLVSCSILNNGKQEFMNLCIILGYISKIFRCIPYSNTLGALHQQMMVEEQKRRVSQSLERKYVRREIWWVL